MIIKGQARGRAQQLAAHLLRRDENETVRLIECRGTLAHDVEGALLEMEARGMAARTQKPLYHASISPEAATPLTEPQIRQAVDLLEEKLGLHGLPRLVVQHRKRDREHIHVVWCRIDGETGTAVHMSWNYRLHEQVSRQLERQFGHRHLDNSYDRPQKKGNRRGDERLFGSKPSRTSIEAVAGEISAIWNGTKDPEALREELAKAGYTLARGDRRAYVVIDREGKVHSLSRRMRGADAAAVRSKLASLKLEQLPSVAMVRQEQHAKIVVGKTRQKFTSAAKEIGRCTAEDRTPLHRAVRQSRMNMRVMVAARASGASTGRLVPAYLRTGRTCSPKPFSYRSRRAALIGEYASKIAVALRYLSPEQIDAALAALRSERDAALDLLKLGHRILHNKICLQRMQITRRRNSASHARGKFSVRAKLPPL